VFASYKRDAAILPEDERQIMVFMARFSFMPRLNCVARNLPSSLSTDPLRMVDALAIETIAACAGLSSSQDLTEDQRGKITLPTRWGGALPGFGVSSPAQAASSATAVEAYLKGLYNLERGGVHFALDTGPHPRSLYEPFSGGTFGRDSLGTCAARRC
jgi:hypothetical protein